MKPTKKKTLISMAILVGLIFTYGCGGAKMSSSFVPSTSGTQGGVTVSNDVDSPAEMNVGDIMMVQFDASTDAEFDFNGADESSEYYMGVGSFDVSGSLKYVQIDGAVSALGSESVAEAVYEESEWKTWTVADAFSQRMHDVALSMALDYGAEVASPPVSGPLSAKSAVPDFAVSVGDQERLKVLNSLSSLSSYTTITATVECVTDNIVLYADNEIEEDSPGGITAEDIDELCVAFDEYVTLERSWYGNESDVNGDGRVASLVTSQVNKLGSMGGGIITGFFLASDLYSAATSPISNEREIVYVLAPDPNGIWGTAISKSFWKSNLIHAVLAHEFQHVISYNQHVFEGEGSTEENWLNEGMSHLTEDLVSRNQENPSRVDIMLNSTTYYPVVASGSPDLGERGASYLFMRFLYEQSDNPSQFVWKLYHNNIAGVTNLENAFAGSESTFDQFGEFFMRWMVAMIMTDRGLSEDERYVYQERVYNSTTDSWQGICLICSADDNRGTILTGPAMSTYSGSATNVSLYPSTAKYYDVPAVPDKISFNGVNTGSYAAVLVRKQ